MLNIYCEYKNDFIELAECVNCKNHDGVYKDEEGYVNVACLKDKKE